MSWQSRSLIAEILKRAANDDIEKLKYAGLVLLKHNWCWNDFLALNDPQMEWAHRELAKWVTKDDGAPECVTKYLKEDAAEAKPAASA